MKYQDCGEAVQADESADTASPSLPNAPPPCSGRWSHVLELIGDGNRFPDFAKPAAYSAEAAASAAKAASAGEARLDKIVRRVK